MLLYSLIMFLVTALLMAISIAIYKGNTNLIHDYHQTNVTDKAAYGKAFGKSLFVVSMATLLSGIISLFGDSKTIASFAVGTLFVGMGIGIGCIIAVQKKYNKGLF